MRIALAFALALPLGACGSQITGTVEQMCGSLPPVTVSKCDVLTDETAQGIEADNVAKETWCGIRKVERKKTACKATKIASNNQ